MRAMPADYGVTVALALTVTPLGVTRFGAAVDNHRSIEPGEPKGWIDYHQSARLLLSAATGRKIYSISLLTSPIRMVK